MCRQYDSRESGSWEEKTPIHPEIECRIRFRMRSFELFVLGPLTNRLLIKANDSAECSVQTGLPSNVMSTYFKVIGTMALQFYFQVCGLCTIL